MFSDKANCHCFNALSVSQWMDGADLRIYFLYVKNAIQLVLDISLISPFFYINNYLSIATQPSLCWTV